MQCRRCRPVLDGQGLCGPCAHLSAACPAAAAPPSLLWLLPFCARAPQPTLPPRLPAEPPPLLPELGAPLQQHAPADLGVGGRQVEVSAVSCERGSGIPRGAQMQQVADEGEAATAQAAALVTAAAGPCVLPVGPLPHVPAPQMHSLSLSLSHTHTYMPPHDIQRAVQRPILSARCRGCWRAHAPPLLRAAAPRAAHACGGRRRTP
jgi:hypothetical protein